MLSAVIFLLEGYALLLAWLHGLAGVQTDEAKYLLNIPYPHPPLLRWIMGLTTSWSFQEMFWRVLLATLIVQVVWLVWDMTRGLPKSARLATCAAWLLSPSILLQGGTVMLAPVTALIALVMLWLLLRQRQGMEVTAEVWGFLWVIALLTAYQGVTLLPLVFAGIRRSDVPMYRRISAFVLPLFLLILVTVTNPLAVATMVIHADEGARMTFADHAKGALLLWTTAGPWIVGIVGAVGLLAQRRWDVLGAFALTTLFVLGSAPFPFYGILFLPFLVEGVRAAFIAYPRYLQAAPTTFIAFLIVGGLWLRPWERIPTGPSVARTVMHEINSRITQDTPPWGTVGIIGSFGHQWSYESALPIARGIPEGTVQFVVCLEESCDAPEGYWKRIENLPVPVWETAMKTE